MWNWGSPVAWAVFAVGAGICIYLLALALRMLATIGWLEESINKRR